jgi:hypothetical protein
MSELEVSQFKKNVFDEKLLQFCLGIIELSDFSQSNPKILRQALLDSLGFCNSVEELKDYWIKLSISLSAIKSSRTENTVSFDLSTFVNTNCSLGQKKLETLHDFLFTVNKLSGAKSFQDWNHFLSGVNTLASSEAQLGEFLNTTRFLCETELFVQWLEFFTATKTIEQSQPAEAMTEFFSTTRHLSMANKGAVWEEYFSTVKTLSVSESEGSKDFFVTVRYLLATQFSGWKEFFPACKNMQSLSNVEIVRAFEAIRHSRSYFTNLETFQNLVRTLTNFPQYSEAFAYGQLDSKQWLLEEATKVWGKHWGKTVFVLAGWVGLLPRMMYDQQIKAEKIRSFDLDARANQASESINQKEVQQDWSYKSATCDILQMTYPLTYKVLRKDGSACELEDMPDVVINTSCEHIQDIDGWWGQIPSGTKVILQSNDGFHIPGHVNCFKSLQDFSRAMKLSRIDYEGEKALPEFTRFMLIGLK